MVRKHFVSLAALLTVGVAALSACGGQTAGVATSSAPAVDERARLKVRQNYQAEAARAGGIWNSYISVTGQSAVDDKSD